MLIIESNGIRQHHHHHQQQQADAELADMFCMKFIKSSTSSSVLSDGSFSNISWTVSRKTTA